MSSNDSQFRYQNLPVHLRVRDDQGTAELGLEVGGEFLGFAHLKVGRLHKVEQRVRDNQQQPSQQSQ